ncbi:alpha/beta hydrolase [Marininema halotolerans]|uniref:Lysophospholipase, alpha-beta hydrolase superfamily n=1 Tax=Marininema halotolerans TaxID=1155944 RepID=A0A1I6QM03_9BACL|nr:alpha/beta hydrolase [Marininema halotolerans]SFS53481.1 Lysophospholipase, alpha-beta hydrolase superfamily [Marininema halotolerans]
MKVESFTFTTHDGENIFVHKWLPEGEVKGTVQIAHGMAEHAARYQPFAEALTQAGYRVFANDHRGHGQTASTQERLGHFADEDGWMRTITDMYELTKEIKREFPDEPIVLFGHSMGSFLARRYVQLYGEEVQGLILSGTGTDQGFLSFLGLTLAKLQRRVKGKRARSKLLDRLSFGKFNQSFQPIRTSFDWLSRDEKEVDKYIEDPMCGQIATTQFFCDMIAGVKELDRVEQLRKIPNHLPIYLFSGEKDPVGAEGKGVKKVAHLLRLAGNMQVNVKIYEEGRHEMLNEMNKAEVYQDVIAWLDQYLTHEPQEKINEA